MRPRLNRFVFVVFFVICLVSSISSRHFAPHNNNHGDTVFRNLQPLQKTKSTNEGKIEGIKYEDEKKIGSSPPSCEGKCYGCMPCEAIQVPTTSNHVGLFYTNYEPEGWKCKCGPTFYTP